MYLLIPKRRKRAPLGLTYLHPTMYLLIPIPQLPNLVLSNTFTSHYVSINSQNMLIFIVLIILFTSHYVSINSKTRLHKLPIKISFTSHYVSINSSANTAAGAANTDLHPTMYLLIRAWKQ